MERSHAQAVMDDLHDALGRRLAVSSLAPCPVEFTAALVNLCSTQSCGKCTPCRVGLSALSDLLADVLEGRADESTLNLIERTARTIYLSSDCAIGYEADQQILEIFDLADEVKVNKANLKKAVGRKLAARVLSTWVEDFVDEDTGEVVSIERNNVIVDRETVLEEEHVDQILESGAKTILLHKENL